MTTRSTRPALTLTLTLVLAGLSVSAAHADESVVPGAYTATVGTGTFLGPLANAPRTYQWLIHSDQLAALVGKDLTGITYRNTGGSTTAWPTAAADFASYDIRLSESVTPASRSLTFASNIVGDQTLVRSGALHIEPLVFEINSPAPHPFGPVIAFDAPWHYAGGHLLIEVRHTGVSGTSRSVDAIVTSTAGYGTQFSAAWTGNYTGVSGTQGNFSIIELSWSSAGSGACNLADITNVGDTGTGPDGQLTYDDILLFINTFGDGTGCPGAAPCSVADITNVGDTGAGPDGQLTYDDLLLFINTFGEGC